jgi:hypothetical protein
VAGIFFGEHFFAANKENVFFAYYKINLTQFKNYYLIYEV